jgi:hypothetical protein
MVREYTNKLEELCEEGVLTKESIFDELMCYLSEDDIKEFCEDGFGGEIRDLFKEVEK